MNNKLSILMLFIFLAGCSGLPNLPALSITATPFVPTKTPTPLPSGTPAPTQNLFATSTSTPLTFTPTVTPIGAELFTPTNTETPFPTPGLPPAVINGEYFTPTNIGFRAVLISNNTIYWNEGPCMPRDIKVSAFVEDLANTHQVLLFLRLREKKNTLNVTDWGAGAIMNLGENGAFSYDVHTWNIRHYFYFTDAWLEYQLVAVNEDQEVIGRTQIYDRNISLVRCKPVP